MAILSGIAGQTALAISATRLYQQSVRHESLEHELRLAREIQESFLPEHCPDYPGWEIAVDWRAARGVGGDYYDFIEFGNGSLGVSIADVSDKGVAAALYMAMSRSVLRAASLDAHSPAETLQRANRVLMQESRSGMFVSLVYAIMRMDTGSVRYVRAGHNIPLHMHVDGTISLLAPAGIALGIMQDPELEEDAITLEPGESLVLYTDGITEAWNEAEDEFGMQRLLDVVASGAGASPEELIGRVRDAVEAFVGRGAQSDDYTILVVKRAEKACAG
jgi:sigma-B regulation protein RsbU (phosphoserine phosphatase)